MRSLNVAQIAVGGFDDNFSYVVFDEQTRKALAVDPAGRYEQIFDVIEQCECTLSGILITHSHFDHIEKVEDMLSRGSVPVYVHSIARAKMDVPEECIVELYDNSIVELGEGEIKVLHTPGHIADAVCYYIEKEQASDQVPKLITGDTVFVEGCGRTNENDVEKLYKSLQRLKDLPDETEIYPGHDYGSAPMSTIAQEKTNNKYFTAPDLAAFKQIRLG